MAKNQTNNSTNRTTNRTTDTTQKTTNRTQQKTTNRATNTTDSKNYKGGVFPKASPWGCARRRVSERNRRRRLLARRLKLPPAGG